jgi:hypothetical protein
METQGRKNRQGSGPVTGSGADPVVREGFPAWGFALIAVLALMLGANGIMVWLSSRGHRDLVRADYYDAALDQDGVIARTGLARLPGMAAELRREGRAWRAETPGGRLDGARCRIRLYRPDDGRDDRDVDLGAPRPSPDGPGRIRWSGTGPALRPGYWTANVVWEENGKPVMEESFTIRVDG